MLIPGRHKAVIETEIKAETETGLLKLEPLSPGVAIRELSCYKFKRVGYKYSLGCKPVHRLPSNGFTTRHVQSSPQGF